MDADRAIAVGLDVAGSSYLYDADGDLLLQADPGTTTLYLPDQQIALNTSTGATSTTRYYALPGGEQVVRTGTGSNYDYEFSDQHGTSSLELNSTFTSPTWRQFTPFGAPRGTTPSSWPDNRGFLDKVDRHGHRPDRRRRPLVRPDRRTVRESGPGPSPASRSR